jgi:hypothetical protein
MFDRYPSPEMTLKRALKPQIDDMLTTSAMRLFGSMPTNGAVRATVTATGNATHGGRRQEQRANADIDPGTPML